MLLVTETIHLGFRCSSLWS